MSFAVRRPAAATVYLCYVAADGLIRSLLFTVLAVYFVERVHMDPLQLVLVGTVLESTIFLLELPTGILADTYSRKLSVIVGQALFGLAYLVQATVTLFVPVLLAEVVRGAGETFISGALQAWITDEVGSHNVARLFLRGFQLRRLAWLVGIALSVGLANIDLGLPILIGSVLSILFALALVLVMPEQQFQRAQPGSKNTVEWFATARSALVAVRGTPVLLALLALAAILGAASEGFDRLWEAHLLLDFELPAIGSLAPVTWFGLIQAGGLAISVVMAHLVSRLNTRPEDAIARILFIIQALRALAICVFGLTNMLPIAIVARWAADGLHSLHAPLLDAWIARTSPANVRATVFSVMSQGDALGQALGGPVIGLLGTWVSLRAAMVASASLLLPGVLLLRLAGVLALAAAPSPSPSASAEPDRARPAAPA